MNMKTCVLGFHFSFDIITAQNHRKLLVYSSRLLPFMFYCQRVAVLERATRRDRRLIALWQPFNPQ